MINYIKICSIGIFVFCYFLMTGQTEIRQGKITFVTKDNVYVRFGNTDGIEEGDTIFINQNGSLIPCMTVDKKSSTSCICIHIHDCSIKKDDAVSIEIKAKKEEEEEEPKVVVSDESATNEERVEKKRNLVKKREQIRARISASSYSGFSTEQGREKHRLLTRFSFNGNHIGNSNFSVESYLSYKKNFFNSSIGGNTKTSFLRLYNLALSWDIDSTMRVSIGRKINRKISSIGPIDGLQAEKYFGPFFIGAIGGFRPDIQDFGFNFDLLQYGAYIGHYLSGKKIYTQTTVGLLEQRNGAFVDRRYSYFQHSSTIGRKLNIFASMEVDLYDKNLQGEITNKMKLTNMYVSLRYKFSRRFSLMVSYDTRKRIIYYETLRTELERLLADDEARQGLRARISFRPLKYINAGISYSRRFQNSKQNRSDNINGFISHSRLPLIGGRLSINYNINKSNYLSSNIISIRHSRSLIRKKLNGDFYFRRAMYVYGDGGLRSAQNYFGANFTYRITKTLRFSLLGELSTRKDKKNARINTKLIKRFRY